jgi:hypothetical protein
VAAIVAALITASQVGCATTATMTAMKPAEVPLGQVRSVAVLPFSGPQDVAEAARQAVATRLGEDNFCTIVAPQEFENFAAAPLRMGNGPVDNQVAIETARRMNLDAIVVGRLARRRHSRFGSSSTVLIGDPVVSVAVEFQMIDVRSGRVLASNRVENSHTGELSTEPDSPESEPQVLQRLSVASAREAVAKLIPHETTVRVSLADQKFGKGLFAVRAGNKLAKAGDWRMAATKWREALSASPENSAAMYNLGVAYEAARDFDEAARMYTAAAALDESDRCQQALQRVERHRDDYQLAMAQFRRPSPSETVHALANGPSEPPMADGVAPLVSPYTPPPRPAASEISPRLELQPPANSSQAVPRSARREMMRLPPL